MSTTAQWLERYSGVYMKTYGSPRTTLVRGEGCYVWDADGNRYLDLLAGIAVNALGHAHPKVVEAVTRQLSTLGHVSNFFTTPSQVELSERLLGLLGASGRVFLANSGTEANEAAFKMTRRTGRTKLVAATGAFHGRTMGALALTAKQAYREPFEPLPGDVVFVEYGDPEALREAVDDSTAAVVLEAVQGEAGAVVPPAGYLETAREATTAHGALLWFDEVQSGIGRTGWWFAHQAAGVSADVVTVAKGLGAGVPIGATIGVGAAGDLLGPGNHGTTFGGNP
ncbi:MAG: acetylornithine transaminase, partial [Nocardioidaceae bacterium]